MRSFSGLQRL